MRVFIACIMLGVGALFSLAYAQDLAPEVVPQAAEGGEQAADATVIELKQQDIAPIEKYPENIRSLFYTEEEYSLLKESLRRRVAPSLRKQEEEEKIMFPLAPVVEAAPPPRIIHLSGIVYASPGEWTLWLNGKRVVPGTLSANVKALSVTKEYADLKWFDKTKNQIISVRMRPHQRFNVDTRTFFTGAAFSGSTDAVVVPDMREELDDLDIDEEFYTR